MSVESTDNDDVRPACPVARQCSGNDFRIVSSSKVVATFNPCRNSECFGDRDPEPGEQVVVSPGRGTKSMHAPQKP